MTQTARKSRLRIVLASSLLLNLFFVGLVGVRLGFGWFAAGQGPLHRELDAYPMALKREFRHELISKRVALENAADQLRSSRAKVRALVAADDIDVPALRAAFAEVRGSLVGLVTILQDALLAASLQVPAETRREIPIPEAPMLDFLETEGDTRQ